MNKTARKRPLKYTHSMGRVYLSVTTAILSIATTVMLLRGPVLWLYYIACTVSLAIVTFVMKIRLASMRGATSEEGPLPRQESAPGKRLLILVFAIAFAIVASPFLLAGFLPSDIWFIVIVSLATGFSLSDIALYVYCEKMVT